MLSFLRRKRGKHDLGAAVTAIPSQPVPPVVPAYRPSAALQQLVPVQASRVELGFRDGSTAALAPGSEQALALNDLASVLTRRDS